MLRRHFSSQGDRCKAQWLADELTGNCNKSPPANRGEFLGTNYRQDASRSHALARGLRAFLVLLLIGLNSAAAQQQPADQTAGPSCKFEDSAIFKRRPVGVPQVVAAFIDKPRDDAAPEKLKDHILYRRLLGRLASTALSDASARTCAFGSEVNSALDLVFELNDIGRGAADECALNRCTRWMADIIMSTRLDEAKFAAAANAIAATIRQSDNPNPAHPRLGAQRASQEAYRHIYAPGTKARILVDVSAQDFVTIDFGRFTAWFETQQSLLRTPIDQTTGPQASGAAAPCTTGKLPDVEDINIDRAGWGQRSIILIRQAFTAEGVSGISNPSLRSLCHPGDSHNSPVSAPWATMAERVGCAREQLGDDRWLVLFSKRNPALSRSEMHAYAGTIAHALEADRCVSPSLRIFIANFLQEN